MLDGEHFLLLERFAGGHEYIAEGAFTDLPVHGEVLFKFR
jgi:hypothetical protein